jgi:ABC-type Fe3+/spermidine/putrescine transport system ATPase subunit
MFDGRIHQLGAPPEIYHRPETATVAEFIGLTNFIAGKVTGIEGETLALETVLGPLRCRGRAPEPGRRDRLLAVRPEALQLGGQGPADPALNRLQGVVTARAFLGNLVDYRVEVAPSITLRVQGDPHMPFGVGDRVAVSFDPAATWSVPPRDAGG